MLATKLWKKLLIFTMLFVLILSGNVGYVKAENVRNIPSPSTKVQIFKTWNLALNQEIDPRTIKENVFVVDSKQQNADIEVEFGSNSKSIIIKPPTFGYKYDSTYTIIIKNGLKSKSGKKLQKEIRMVFETESSPVSVGDAEIKEDIVAYVGNDLQNIFDNIQEITRDEESGQTTIVLNKKDNNLSELKENDIFVLDGTNEFPLGLVGKVEEIHKNSNNTELVMTQPTIDEVFSELDMKVQRNLSPYDVVATEAVEGVTVFFKTEKETAQAQNFNKGTLASLDNLQIAKNIEHDLDFTPKGNFGIEVEDLVLYDHDGDTEKNKRENNKNGQVVFDGSFFLQNPIIDLEIKYDASVIPPFIEFDRFKAKLTGNIHNGINIYTQLNQEFGLGELQDKGKNKIKKFRYSIEGVKPDKKKFTLATTLITPGVVPVTLKGGTKLNVPLGLAIEFTLTEGGVFNAELVADLTSDIYFEKGFDIKFDGTSIEDVTPYDTVNTSFNMGLNVNGEISITQGIGVDFSVILLGLVPAKITNDLQLTDTIKGSFGINVSHNDTDGFSLTPSGCAEYDHSFQFKSEGLIRLAIINHKKNQVTGINTTIPIYLKKFFQLKDNMCIKPKINYEPENISDLTFVFDSKDTESRMPLNKYEWTINKVNDEKNVKKLSGQQIEYSFPKEGEYEVKLKVTDTNGSYGTTTEKVKIDKNWINLKEAQKRSRYTTTMKDVVGNEYTAYFLGVNDKKRVADDFAGYMYSKGDTLYEGDFQIGIHKKNAKYVRLQSDKIKNYQYNKTEGSVFTVKSNSDEQPDFLLVSNKESSSAKGARIYYIKDGNGNIHEAKVQSKYGDGREFSGIAYFIPPKSIGENKMQLIDYYRDEIDYSGYEFVTYKFDPETGLLTYKGSKFFFGKKLWDKGEQEVEKWRGNPKYFVETPEKYSDYF